MQCAASQVEEGQLQIHQCREEQQVGPRLSPVRLNTGSMGARVNRIKTNALNSMLRLSHVYSRNFG